MTSERRSSRRLQAQHGVKSMKDDSDSDDDSESGSGDDDDAQKDAGIGVKKAPARAPKGTKAAKTTNPVASPSGQKPKAAPKQARASTADLSGLTLYDILGKHPDAVSRAAKEWVKEYQEDNASAMAKLMSLVAQTAGCEEEISRDEAEEGEVDDLVKKMAEYVIKNSCIDPLHDKRYRAFPSSYQSFWSCLVSELYAATLVLDDFLVQRLSGLVISLSCSPVRLFRLAGTLTASYLMAGWVEVQKMMARDLAQTQFQMDAEGKKKPANKSLVDGLKRQLDQQHRRSNDLDMTAKNLITAVFAVRFRDCWEEVRAVVIHSFAAWIEASPETYLADAHLKYLGWALSDMDASVRLEAVSGVTALYKSRDNVLGLHEFKARFDSRFRELIWDKDEQVTVKALELLTKLVEVDELDKAALRGDVYQLLTDSSLAIRQGASELVAALLLDAAAQTVKDPAIQPAVGSSAQASQPARGKKQAAGKGKAAADETQGEETEKQALQSQLGCLLDLMDILQRGDSSSGGSAPCPMEEATVEMLVNALYGRLPVLSDWRALLAALLEDVLLEERGRVAAVHLALLLVSAVKLGGQAPEPNKAKQARGKAAVQQADVVHELSLDLVTQMPKLLSKHQTEATIVTALIGLVPCMRMEVYSLKQEERGFSKMLQQVSEQMFKHADDVKLVNQVVQTLVFCAAKGPGSLQPAAQVVLSDTVAKAAKQLVACAKTVQGLDEDTLKDEVAELESARSDGAENLYRLKCALTRVNSLILCGARSMASQTQVFEVLDYLVEDSRKAGRRLGPTLMKLALSTMHAAVMWTCVKGLSDGDRGSHGEAAIKELQQRSQILLQQELLMCSSLAEDGDASEERAMSNVMMISLADCLLLFSGESYKDSPLEQAICEFAPDDAIRELWRLCVKQLDYQQQLWEQSREDLADEITDTEPKEEGKDGVHAEAADAARVEQLQAVAVVGKLLCAPDCLSYRHFRWLAAHLMSKMAAHGQDVEESVKDMLRVWRSKRPEVMAEVYVGAMKLAYNTVLEASQEINAEDSSSFADALQDFSELCKKLAAMYSGHNLHRDELLCIVRGGLQFSLDGPPTRLHFTAWGLGHFTAKLAQEDTQQLVVEVENLIQDLPEHDPEDEAWRPLYQYLTGLQERAIKSKAAARGALKGSNRVAAAPKPRKISFAPEMASPADEEPPADEAVEAAKPHRAVRWGAAASQGPTAAATAAPAAEAGRRRQRAAAPQPAARKPAAKSVQAQEEEEQQQEDEQEEKPIQQPDFESLQACSGLSNSMMHGSRSSPEVSPAVERRRTRQNPEAAASKEPLQRRPRQRNQKQESEKQAKQEEQEEEEQEEQQEEQVSQDRGKGHGKRSRVSEVSEDEEDKEEEPCCSVHEASQVTTGGVEPPAREKRRRRV